MAGGRRARRRDDRRARGQSVRDSLRARRAGSAHRVRRLGVAGVAPRRRWHRRGHDDHRSTVVGPARRRLGQPPAVADARRDADHGRARLRHLEQSPGAPGPAPAAQSASGGACRTHRRSCTLRTSLPRRTAPAAPGAAPGVCRPTATSVPAKLPGDVHASAPTPERRRARRRRPRPRPSAPVAAAVGRVLIRSSPSGEVRVNGIARGETPVPCCAICRFGQCAVTVTRAGFAPVEREVSLLASRAGGLAVGGPRAAAARRRAARAHVRRRPLPWNARLAASPPAAAPHRRRAGGAQRRRPLRRLTPAYPARHGGIFVVSTPSAGAGCSSTGSRTATHPASVPGLPQGAHVVRVEAPGYRPWEGRVAVVAGTRVRVVATLQQGQE